MLKYEEDEESFNNFENGFPNDLQDVYGVNGISLPPIEYAD